jgi:Flp pilus assembly protein TadG
MKARTPMPRLSRLAREEHGAELVEFAMTALILMTLVAGVIGFALAMYTYHFVSFAAQQGARFAIVRGHTWSENETANCSTSPPPNFTMVYNCTASATDIQNYVQSLAPTGINPSSVTIDTSSSDVWPGVTPDGDACSPTNSQGCLVKVTVKYTFDYLKIFGLQNLSAWSMSATSEGVILQ